MTALLSLGVGAYYGLEAADRLLMARLGGVYEKPLPVVAEPPSGATEPEEPAMVASRAGNRWLKQARLSLENRQSLVSRLSQTGWIHGREFNATGVYRQLGDGPEPRFSLQLQGQLAGEPARLLRVSDSRYLWTDLQWGDQPQSPEQKITRVDLRQVRRALDPDRIDSPQPGSASAVMMDPSSWSRTGGLPMLLAGLDRSFNFGDGRLMQLRGERVVALVGRWDPERLNELLATGSSETQLNATAPQSMPERVPQHVVVALSESTLFPLLVEYRSIDDPMSADGLEDDAMLRPSNYPFFKIDFDEPQFDVEINPSYFAYQPPAEADFVDQTDRELRLVENLKAQRTVATAGGTPRRQ